jgi:hypothetical protein
MTSKRTILAFDIGIKNLAYAVVEQGGILHSLENANIMDVVEPVMCKTCAKVKAAFKSSNNYYCKRHIPSDKPVLKIPGANDICKKIPTMADLRKIAKEHNIKGTKKDDLIQSLEQIYTFPFSQPKQEKAGALSLATLHDLLRRFVSERWDTIFSKCTEILLENQPAFKNPHMKSVQVLLFATLRDAFYQRGIIPPPFHLVHAKLKVADAKSGDEGYSERKQKSEERVAKLFSSNNLKNTTLEDMWKKSKKKSDMADAICMCVDFLSHSK